VTLTLKVFMQNAWDFLDVILLLFPIPHDTHSGYFSRSHRHRALHHLVVCTKYIANVEARDAPSVGVLFNFTVKLCPLKGRRLYFTSLLWFYDS